MIRTVRERFRWSFRSIKRATGWIMAAKGKAMMKGERYFQASGDRK